MSVENPFENNENKQEHELSSEKETSTEIIEEQREQLRDQVKRMMIDRHFIFFGSPRSVSCENISYLAEDDKKDLEVIGVRRRRNEGYSDPKLNTLEEDVEFLVWRPQKTSEGEWYPSINFIPRHLVEANNDLLWVRDELGKVSDEEKTEEFGYISNDMAETLDDRYRREWVEKRIMLEKYREEWGEKALEQLEREYLDLMEQWKNGSEMYLQMVVPMIGKITGPHSPVHEELIKMQVVRDFFWHLSELASNTRDEAKKEEYTRKTIEAKKLVDEYDKLINEKKAY
ncbi:MAG: hypothetical protein FJZ43_00805 [Candidatus Staskawiczbacteria bacterium]|nr:hypothetical protein [Candidatus Staskawiczbacteria bacterium]